MTEASAPLADRLREALVEEYAAEQPHWDPPKWAEARGRAHADQYLPRLLRALDRAGLVLAERAKPAGEAGP